MSILLYVYSGDPPLERDVVARACDNPGLEAGLRWQVAFFSGAGGPPLPNGPVSTGSVVGWRPGSPDAAAVLAAVERADYDAQAALHARGAFASVLLKVVTRGSPEWDDEEIAQGAAAAPERHRAEVLRANTVYALETPVRASEGSATLQRLLWSVFGVMSNGFLEDPQEGEFTVPREEIAAIEAGKPLPPKRRPHPLLELARLSLNDGWTLVTVAAVLALLLQLAGTIYFATVLGPSRVAWHLVPIAAIAASWYMLRRGDRDGWWLLLAMAGGIVAQSLWNLPRVSEARAAMLWVRVVGYSMVMALLLHPAVREMLGVGSGGGNDTQP